MQPAALDDDRLARHNALVLAAAHGVGGANAGIVITTGGLVGAYLSGEPALATLPFSVYMIGVACGTVPASRISRSYGRRAAFLAGALIGAAGGLVAMVAILSGSFALFCAGTALCGVWGAFVQLFRFAAADDASPAFRPRAISWVLAGGILAGIVGPQLIIATRDLTDPIPFAGAYAAQVGVTLVAGLIIAIFLKPSRPVPVPAAGTVVRSVPEILRDRRLLVAMAAGVASFFLMNFVMTASPLAMVACGHSLSDAAWTIQWHVLAMYGPSFFTGGLIARHGATRIGALGFVLIAAGSAVALTGLSTLHFDAALILLGVGWNFSFISATAMVAAAHAPAERNRVQMVNDFAVFGTVTVGSLMSGGVLHVFGWQGINIGVFPIAAVGLAILMLALPRDRRGAAA